MMQNIHLFLVSFLRANDTPGHDMLSLKLVSQTEKAIDAPRERQTFRIEHVSVISDKHLL